MSTISTYLQTVYDELLENSYIDNKTNRLYVGSDYPLFEDLSDDDFPRVDLVIEKDKMDGYQAQRLVQWEFRFDLIGTMRIDEMSKSSTASVNEMMNLFNFGVSIRKTIYSILDKKQAGTVSVPGFLMYNGYAECVYDHNLAPQHSQFIWDFGAVFQLNDIDD